MKKIVLGVLALTAIVGAGSIAIAQSKIRDLHNANSTTITGKIVQLRDDEFIIDDGTGQLLVETEDRTLRTANLKNGETVTVKGRYDDNDFEAISITRANGQIIYVFDD
jgi:uncharacterized protein YdeI (BOF family)